MKRILFIILSVFLFLPEAFSEPPVKPGWKAGSARVRITPQQSMWMAGYASRTQPAQGKLHDLWAKALFLEDAAGNTVVLVTSDIIYFPKPVSDKIRDELGKRLGLSRAQIILNSSHTHSGPEITGNELRYSYSKYVDTLHQTNGLYNRLSVEYSERLAAQVVDLVLKARRNLRPSRLYAMNGVVRFQVNRRSNKESGLAHTASLEGPVDYAVPVLKVENKRGKPEAIVFGYACHATVLNGLEWSGDYPGFAQLELEKMYKGANAMFFQGAGADQNPLPRRSVTLARQYGKELAAAVERVLGEEMQSLTPSLETTYSEISLTFEKSDSTAEERLKTVVDSPGQPAYLKRNARYVLEKLEAGEQLNLTSYPYPVQVWKLGEQLMVALGGELVSGYSIALKRIYGEDTFVMGYCNDVCGYIPTAEILQEGGYEGSNPPVFPLLWSSDIEETILKEVQRLVSETGYPRVENRR